MAYVKRDGTLSGDGLKYLDERQLKWANEEAARLLAAVAEHPILERMFVK